MENPFEKIEEGNVVLIKVPSQKLIKTNTDILKFYIPKIPETNLHVVYVTVNKPFASLIEGFKKENIDISKIFFIDAITPRKRFNGETRLENAVLLGSPKELTNISITTTSAIKNLKKAKVLIFDSVTTLLFYNEFNIVKDFICFISNKMKELKVTFAMICISDKTDKKIIDQLSSFVDKVIEIE